MGLGLGLGLQGGRGKAGRVGGGVEKAGGQGGIGKAEALGPALLREPAGPLSPEPCQ